MYEIELRVLMLDQGCIQRGWDRGACPPPQSSSEWIFTEKTALLGLFSLPEVFCGPPISQKCLLPRWGAHDAPPDPLVGWEGETPHP